MTLGYKSVDNHILTLEILSCYDKYNDNTMYKRHIAGNARVLNIYNKDDKTSINNIKQYNIGKETSSIDFYLYEKLAFFDDKQIINGDHKKWFDNGQLQIICTYVNAKLEGNYYEYHSNGKLKKNYNYVNGLKNGECITYDEKENIITKDIYINDSLIIDSHFEF